MSNAAGLRDGHFVDGCVGEVMSKVEFLEGSNVGQIVILMILSSKIPLNILK